MVNFYGLVFFSMTTMNLFEFNFVSLFIIWYVMGGISVCKLYSHVSFMMLSLEMLSLVSMVVMIFLITKLCMSYSFFFFFLCFLVGEAVMGLSLLVASSRISSNELSSMSV